MGGTISSGRDNDELVDNLIEADYLKSVSLQQIFRAVDRGNYYTCNQREKAYQDSAWRSGNLHLSAPCVYSEVMEALKLETGQSFLNLGSGSGYLSTMAGLILGPYGTNHGVEIFNDVVSFAYDRLNDFLLNSEAIDKYEFCAPTFVVGNCLRIDSSSQLYDRVYCGASCPKEHETYMKHLIRVGGILVMPLNNKLLQITRTSESTWKSTKVLSVSFAPLLYPLETEPLQFVKLPDMNPPKLQEICRSVVRTTFRNQIHRDYPNLHVRKSSTSKGFLRQIVIPLIERSESRRFIITSSDDDDDDEDDDSSNDRPSSPPGDSGENRRSLHFRTRAFFQNVKEAGDVAVAGPSNWNDQQQQQRRDGGNEDVDASSDLDALMDSDSASSDSDIETRTLSFACKEKDVDSDAKKSPSTSAATAGKKRRHSGAKTCVVRAKRRTVPARARIKVRRGTATFIWKRVVKDRRKSTEDKAEQEKTAEKNRENYRTLMTEKCSRLPLPKLLQRYLNYDRDIV